MTDRNLSSQARAPGYLFHSLEYTFLDVLLEVGQYTALIEVIFGHEDHFGSTPGVLLENKLALIRGSPSPGVGLRGLPALGPVPPGALAIPRYKVWTIVGAMQDVELHELHGVFHAGRTPTGEASVSTSAAGPSASASTSTAGPSSSTAPLSSTRRANKRRASREEATVQRDLAIRRTCWRRIVVETETGEEDEDGVHYGDGLGLADWMSRFN